MQFDSVANADLRQVGAGELYGLADFVLGVDSSAPTESCLRASSETVKVFERSGDGTEDLK